MTLRDAGGTRGARLALAVLFSIAIFAACSIPGHSLPMSIIWSWDKLWHLAAFGTFAILWRRAGAGVPATALGGFAFGAAIEVWQQFAPIGRFFDELDLAANAAGLVIGLVAWFLWGRLLPRSSSARHSTTREDDRSRTTRTRRAPADFR